MNRVSLFKSKGWAGVGLLVTAVIYITTVGSAIGADTTATYSKTVDAKPADASPAKKTEKKLTGAELYAINCNRCHQERYPTEFTAAQWKTIATHMRVRANLPAAQVKQILKYLQEDAGN